MARQNAFRKRGVYGRDLARELALLEQSVHDKFTNDDRVEFGPFSAVRNVTSTYNAKPWELVQAHPPDAGMVVVLPDPSGPDAQGSWVAVKNVTDSWATIRVEAVNSEVDGHDFVEIRFLRSFTFFFSTGEEWVRGPRIDDALAAGGVLVDWFGAVGDANRSFDTKGTDDYAAIQAAIDFGIQYGLRILFDPRKVYLCSGRLDLSGANGLVLDGQGGANYTHGSWIKFYGAQDDSLIQVFSTKGVRIQGFEFFACMVTRRASDLTYANAAARLASVLGTGDLGKTATDTDTGIVWRLKALPSSVSTNWLVAPFSILDTRHTNWGGIGGTEGADSIGTVISHCTFTGPTNWSMRQAIRFEHASNCSASYCLFQYFQYGVSGFDNDWGSGFSGPVEIDNCIFNAIKTRGVYGLYNNWTISLNTFEPRTDGTFDGVEVADNTGGDRTNIVCVNNWHGDVTAGGGWAYKFTACLGVTLIGNQAYTVAGGTFCYLASCYGVTSHSNFLFGVTNSYDIESSGSPCAALHLGPDSTDRYPTGTNYRSTVIEYCSSDLSKGGTSIGGSNTFNGYNAAAIGLGNTVGAQSLAVGTNNTTASPSLVTGANGIASDSCERVLSGGTTNGVAGGSQLRENVLGKQCLVGTGTILQTGAQSGASITFVNSTTGYIKAMVLTSKSSSGIRASYDIWGHVDKTAGVVSIPEQGIDNVHGPGATGITPSFVIPTGTQNVAISVSVASGTIGPVFATAAYRAVIEPHS